MNSEIMKFECEGIPCQYVDGVAYIYTTTVTEERAIELITEWAKAQFGTEVIIGNVTPDAHIDSTRSYELPFLMIEIHE